MKRGDLSTALDVSRETMQKLMCLDTLLQKWNTAINLVSKSTLDDVWARHILDSVQVYDIAAPNHGKWIDVGTGGGFPGLVVAILAAERAPELMVTMVESDQRKAAFLRTVLRETQITAEVLSERAETLEKMSADFFSARALADLPSLLSIAHRHLKPNGKSIIPKGATWKTEVAAARDTFSFSLTSHRSKTNPSAVILQIEELAYV